MKRAVVIGSGIAGIAASIRLSNKGYSVKVIDSNDFPGGKLTEITNCGFRFDAGPSLFTLPKLVDELFELSGKNPKDYFSYSKLETTCKYFYEDGTVISASSDIDTFANEVEAKTKDSAKSVKNHLANSAFIYNATSSLFLNKSLHKIRSYLSVNTLIAIFKLPFLSIFNTLHSSNTNRFKDNKTIRLFDRYATYNGSNPYSAPGILNIIPHLEHNIGAYFPEGGMHSITKSLYALAKDLGVEFIFNTEVDKIITDANAVKGVHLNTGEYLFCDMVISNADIHYVYKNLLPSSSQLKKVDSQERSSSALIFYWGVKDILPELDVHNIFFSENYKAEFDCLFRDKIIYEDPTIYLNITSIKNPNDAPLGCQNWFVMVNAPSISDKQHWDTIIKQTRGNILSKLERVLNKKISDLILTEDILTPKDIQFKTKSYLGSLYGTSSNKRSAAFFRHKNFSNKYKGLYFVGGSVHPGGGIPLALSSAKIVDSLIK